MTIMHKIERKQVIVLIGSLLLAAFSCFIPIADSVTHQPVASIKQTDVTSDLIPVLLLHDLEILQRNGVDQSEGTLLLTNDFPNCSHVDAVALIKPALDANLWSEDELKLIARLANFPVSMLSATNCQIQPVTQTYLAGYGLENLCILK